MFNHPAVKRRVIAIAIGLIAAFVIMWGTSAQSVEQPEPEFLTARAYTAGPMYVYKIYHLKTGSCWIQSYRGHLALAPSEVCK